MRTIIFGIIFLLFSLPTFLNSASYDSPDVNSRYGSLDVNSSGEVTGLSAAGTEVSQEELDKIPREINSDKDASMKEPSNNISPFQMQESQPGGAPPLPSLTSPTTNDEVPQREPTVEKTDETRIHAPPSEDEPPQTEEIRFEPLSLDETPMVIEPNEPEGGRPDETRIDAPPTSEETRVDAPPAP